MMNIHEIIKEPRKKRKKRSIETEPRRKDPNMEIEIKNGETITVGEFVEFIKQMRESTGMTVNRMAKELDIPQTSLKRYEECQQIPHDVYGFLWKLRKVVRNHHQSNER